MMERQGNGRIAINHCMLTKNAMRRTPSVVASAPISTACQMEVAPARPTIMVSTSYAPPESRRAGCGHPPWRGFSSDEPNTR